MTVLTYIQSHVLPQQAVPLVRESEVVCVVVVVVGYYFRSFQFITHSFLGTSNSLKERVTEQDREMRGAQECGRRDKGKKSKDKREEKKKKRRWLVMDDFHTIQILENRKTQ